LPYLQYDVLWCLQICRVEDVIVEGVVRGSIVHIHRARTVKIKAGGLITASGQGDTSIMIV
jgi:cytoskeletal protein CcmA (bactofilin family)